MADVRVDVSMYDYQRAVVYNDVTYYVIEIFDGYALTVKENPKTAEFPLQPHLIPWPIQNNK